MNTGRDQILGGIRRALRRGMLDDATSAKLRDRLAAPPRNLVPARATALDPAARIALFIALAEEVQATVVRVDDTQAVPAAVADYLSRHNLPAQIVMTPDAALAEIPWHERPLLQIRRGTAEDGDAVGVTACFAAIAETGTLMLLSGPDRATRNNFLPDTHIVVVRADQIVASYEEGWTRLRAATARVGDGWAVPRTVNFITGPSRTADIEQRMELGAHGPRRLHIILIGEMKDADATSQP